MERGKDGGKERKKWHMEYVNILWPGTKYVNSYGRDNMLLLLATSTKRNGTLSIEYKNEIRLSPPLTQVDL